MTLTLKWYGDKAKAAERRGAGHGLYLGAEHVGEEADRIIPISPPGEMSSGTLMRSKAVSVDEGALQAAVSYDTPYAVIQHEDLTFQHDPGRQAKYLEQPINDAGVKRKVEDLIAREIKRALG